MTVPPRADTVVLIGGTCDRTLNWQGWMTRYTARGYSVIGTGVPLRRHQAADCLGPRDPANVDSVLDYYERLLLTVPRPPILIGHCFGGTVVQLLLDRGHGAAGVAVSAPPLAVRRTRPFGLAPSPRRAEPTVDYSSSGRAPLLLIGCGRDRSVPPECAESAAHRYQESDAVTGHLEYRDACHHAVSAPGWEHIADDVLDWAELYAGSGRLAAADLWRR